MKKLFKYLLCLPLFYQGLTAFSQSTLKEDTTRSPYLKNVFGDVLHLNGETVYVPSRNTLQFMMQHRFGRINDYAGQLLGIYGPSNIRIGLSYSILDNVAIGLGVSKNKMITDLNYRWTFLRQTEENEIPLSLSYSGNIGMEGLDKENYDKFSHRLTYFHRISIAKKFGRKLSLGLSPVFYHYNVVDSMMKHDNFGLSLHFRYRVSIKTSIIAEYDQQLSFPDIDRPLPNAGLGIEILTRSHVFQVFVSSFDGILPQYNFMFNTNDLMKGGILLGFNISRNFSL